jgi:hypothetical protein
MEKQVMWCTDPFLDYLKAYGYCIIRLPKADVRPLQIFAKQGRDLERLGELSTLLQAGSNIPLPPLNENVPVANISGRRTGDLSIGIGISLLNNILGAMGGSGLNLDVHYKQAKSVIFEFSHVLEDKVELVRLDQYLADADVNPFSHYIRTLLEADTLYVTTATIKTHRFTVEAKKSDGTALSLPIPEIQSIVGGNVKVSSQVGVSSKVTFEGSLSLVFGFQAVQLFYDQGRYTAFEPHQSRCLRTI